MQNAAGKHISSPLARCLRHLKTTPTTLKLFGCGHCNGGLQVMHSECLWRFPVKER